MIWFRIYLALITAVWDLGCFAKINLSTRMQFNLSYDVQYETKLWENSFLRNTAFSYSLLSLSYNDSLNLLHVDLHRHILLSIWKNT